MDLEQMSFNFEIKPIEITRDNWIIASSVDNANNYYYELHYCSSHMYRHGLLIDDVWCENANCLYARKIDVYIVAEGLQLCEDFTLDSTYTYFLKCKNVYKHFISLVSCSNSISEYIINNQFITCYEEKSKEPPLLSVITTVFNNAKLLEQTIQSVINQTSGSFEYIVKDAKSKDNFIEVISKYSDYDIKVISEKDNGIYEGMHQGFIAAKGKYLQILNSDDLFKSNIIVERYVDAIKTYNADGYCSDILIKFPNGKTMLRKADLSKLYYRACVNHTSLAISKDAYYKVGGFDLSYRISSDYDLTIKLVKAGFRIEHIDIVCVNFRGDGASCSHENFSDFVESLKCRYHVHPFNIIGYGYVILRKIKQMIINVSSTNYKCL